MMVRAMFLGTAVAIAGFAGPVAASPECLNCARVERTPAYFAETTRRAVVAPGTVTRHVVPARVITVRETIGQEPPRRALVQRVDSHGNVVWCEEWVAGRRITVARRVVQPARVITRHTPPEVHTLPHRVLVQPARERIVAASPRWRPAEPHPWW